MIENKTKILLIVVLLIVLGSSMLSFLISEDPAPVSVTKKNAKSSFSEKYVLIKGKKPVDAEIFGYVTSADTNKLCMQENWLSGTKYLSSHDDKLVFITYSDDESSYLIKVPLVPKYSNEECDRKVEVVEIAAKSPGAEIRYAELQIRITPPENHRPSQNISDSLTVKSICQDEVLRGEWLKVFGCNYFNNDNMIAERESNSTTVTLSPDLFKAGTVITYDIIPGENYFPTLERPE